MSPVLPSKVMPWFSRVPTKLQLMHLIPAINAPLNADPQSSKFNHYVLSRFRCLQKDARLLDECIVIFQIIIANSLPIAEGESEIFIYPLIICYWNSGRE
jgi:hypothetical protein